MGHETQRLRQFFLRRRLVAVVATAVLVLAGVAAFWRSAPSYSYSQFAAPGRSQGQAQRAAARANDVATQGRRGVAARELVAQLVSNNVDRLPSSASASRQSVETLGHFGAFEDQWIVDPIRDSLRYDPRWRGSLALRHRDLEGNERYAGELVAESDVLRFRGPSAERSLVLVDDVYATLDRLVKGTGVRAAPDRAFWGAYRAFVLASPFGSETASLAEPLFAGFHAAIFRKRWSISPHRFERLPIVARTTVDGDAFYQRLRREYF